MRVALVGLVALPVLVGLGATLTVVALDPSGSTSSARGGTPVTLEETGPSRQQNVELGRRGTVIEGAKPHLTVINNGTSAVTLPGAIPSIVSILPRSAGPLPPLSPLRPDSPAADDPDDGFDPVDLVESEDDSRIDPKSGFAKPKGPAAPAAPAPPPMPGGPPRGPAAPVIPPRGPAAPVIPPREKPAGPGASQGQSERRPLPDAEVSRGNSRMDSGQDTGKAIEKRGTRAPTVDISNPSTVSKNVGPAGASEPPIEGSDPVPAPNPYAGTADPAPADPAPADSAPAPRSGATGDDPVAPGGPGAPDDPGDGDRSTLR